MSGAVALSAQACPRGQSLSEQSAVVVTHDRCTHTEESRSHAASNIKKNAAAVALRDHAKHC